jgi:hypothetical protein
MMWPVDDLKRMEADELSRWLAGWGLPAVSFAFVDPREGAFVSWQEADEADRRRVLAAIAELAGGWQGNRALATTGHDGGRHGSASPL